MILPQKLDWQNFQPVWKDSGWNDLWRLSLLLQAVCFLNFHVFPAGQSAPPPPSAASSHCTGFIEVTDLSACPRRVKQSSSLTHSHTGFCARPCSVCWLRSSSAAAGVGKKRTNCERSEREQEGILELCIWTEGTWWLNCSVCPGGGCPGWSTASLLYCPLV